MLRAQNPIEALPKAADSLALCVPADQLFSWRVRSFTPPAGWLAWVLRHDQDPLIVRPAESCPHDGVEQVIFVRMAPLDCLIEDVRLQSADGHEFTARLRLPMRVIAEPAELAAFRKTLLGSNAALARADLERYLQWQGRNVLAEWVSRHSAGELLAPLDAAETRRLIDQHLGAACMAGGLLIDGPALLEFESAGYRDHCRRASDLDRRRQEADAQAQIQQALAAAQNQRLSHLIAMLEQMRETSRQHGERSMMELLQAFSPAERAHMYGAMWHLAPAARRTRFVAAVSGMELLLFEPDPLRQPARRHRLPDSLGALRSVTADARSLACGTLLVGAATGVHVVDLETGQTLRTLAAGIAGARPVKGGVNSAAATDDWILGSHSELGLMAWPRAGHSEMFASFLLENHTRRAETVRCLQADTGGVWAAVDERVLRFSPDDPEPAANYPGSRSPISALAVTSRAVYAGNHEGQILSWPIEDPADMSIVRKAGGLPVESVAVLESGGVEWLIAADPQDALVACVLGDTYSCRYPAATGRVRRAVVAEDLFVAMNDNRDRIIAWHPGKPAQPAATVVVPYLTGSSIQDLCLIPA